MTSQTDPETSNYRCASCGRFFNTPNELRQHETECRVAEETTAPGEQMLAVEDQKDYPKNVHREDNRLAPPGCP
jgi:hypothetical protein